MTLTELRLAYAYSFEASSGAGYDKNIISEEGIMDACGDLITTRGDFIFLGHTSIREFLLRPPKQWEDQDVNIEYFRLEPKECQRVIGLACLRYMKDTKWRGPDGECHLPETLARDNPLLCYASSFMVSHLLNSDLQIQDAWSHVCEFFKSENFIACMEFALYLETAEELQTMLPISFWDDTLQFWTTCDDLNATMEHFNSLGGGVGPKLVTRLQNSRLMTGHSTSHPVFSTATSGPVFPFSLILSECDPDDVAPAEPVEREAYVDAKDLLHGAMRRIVANNTKLRPRHLSLILPDLQACIERVDALINPLDALIQSLERSLRGISFLGLMALGGALMETKTEQALRLFQLALEKVEGMNNIRQAWAQGAIGDCFRSLGKLESAKLCYSRSMELLASNPNPITDIFWCCAASCQADCLFRLGMVDEGRMMLGMAEKKLLDQRRSKVASSSESAGTLREWCHQRLESTPWVARLKMRAVLQLGHFYGDHTLDDDVVRLLAPLARDRDMRSLSLWNTRSTLEMLGMSLYTIGNTDEALDTWLQALELRRKHSSKKGFSDESSDRIRYRIAEALYDNGKLDEAEIELSAMNSMGFMERDWSIHLAKSIDMFMDVFMLSGANLRGKGKGKGKATRSLQEYLAVVEEAAVKLGLGETFVRRFVVRRLLAHGKYEQAEAYIRQMISCLSTFRLELTDELYLFEALAISIRYQGPKPKSPDPFGYYQACIVRAQEMHLPKRRIARLHIGFGMLCAATPDKRQDAADAFAHVAAYFKEHVCQQNCISSYYAMFFHGLACVQEQKIAEAVLTLSNMLQDSDLCGTMAICKIWSANYDDYALFSVAILYLSELFDNLGMHPALGEEHRKQALNLLRVGFKEELDTKQPQHLCSTNPWTMRWVRYWVGYLDGRRDGTRESDVGVVSNVAFPFEMFLADRNYTKWDFLQQHWRKESYTMEENEGGRVDSEEGHDAGESNDEDEASEDEADEDVI